MSGYFSQFGEDEFIKKIFDVIGPTNRWCFEVGAADGIFYSNTRYFIKQGWTGILVESDEKKFSKLLERPESEVGVNCFRRAIGIDCSIDDVLQLAEAPAVLDLVSIDIDGQDYYAWLDMVAFRGRVVVIEFNCYGDNADNLPPRGAPLITIPGGVKNQAGINVMMQLAESKGYLVLKVTCCNIICVLKSEIEKHAGFNALLKAGGLIEGVKK
jgi:hypothetical protein